MTMYWQKIKTTAHPRHCGCSSEVKSRHFSPSVSSLSPDLGVGGGGWAWIQMTGALEVGEQVVCHTHFGSFWMVGWSVSCFTSHSKAKYRLWGRDLGLISPKRRVWNRTRNMGSNAQHLVYKASCITTIPRSLLF